MRERAITFSGPEIRAILAGQKTQARRVAKITHRTPGLASCLQPPASLPTRTSLAAELCPHGRPGDKLWVREAWRTSKAGEDRTAPRNLDRTFTRILYDASLSDVLPPFVGKGRPSIHMPRWASRITLRITDVRVERLQDISEADARAEGIASRRIGTGDARTGCRNVYGLACDDNAWAVNDAQAYEHLWESINGAGSWDANPWVWVIEFEKESA